uniref:Uncharacterized protein n=1 Tax=Thalassiosira nordenskioeldii TaxID=83372 RepID=A0A891GTT5_THANO|nr:hypothetical protein K8K90_mgp06 [Thalassiosira nordenskioeldii]QRK25931.1 hypothetical protein [Thalassiosira nordenskioeldii]
MLAKHTLYLLSYIPFIYIGSIFLLGADGAYAAVYLYYVYTFMTIPRIDSIKLIIAHGLKIITIRNSSRKKFLLNLYCSNHSFSFYSFSFYSFSFYPLFFLPPYTVTKIIKKQEILFTLYFFSSYIIINSCIPFPYIVIKITKK